MINVGRETDHWKNNWRSADRIWGHEDKIGKIRLERRAGIILAKLNLMGKLENKRVLELGCGTGTYTKIFATAGFKIIALDLVPEMINEMRGRTRKMKNVRGVVGNSMDLKFGNNSFDAICGNSVLHHLDIDKGISEIYRVLNRGGRIAFTEPNMLNPHIFLQKNIPFLKRMAGDSEDESAIIRWQMITKLQKAGFDEVSVEPFDFLYPHLPVMLIKPIQRLEIFAEKTPILREIAGSVIICAKKL